MNIEELREYCLNLPHVTEDFPFNEDTLVFRIGGKIFLLVSISSQPLQFNVKCDPELAVSLRERYDFVAPGFHMNKRHWNTIHEVENVDGQLLRQWIQHSYMLVLGSLTMRQQRALIP